MKEIKFRAWSTNDKVMIYDLNSPSLKHGVLCGEGYILMQYIGVKDKKGKEIYEEDIISCGDKSSNLVIDLRVAEVCECGGILCGWSLPKNIEEYEVIGNMYENPELMENNK